ncbi:MAG: hypothetical protein Q9227_003966 [Pyrenula ochraceoflavens]
MSHARVEEVSDSDSDPAIDDPTQFSQSIISPASIPQPGSSQGRTNAPPQPLPSSNREIPKHYHMLYPVYFDVSRSRAQGRRVSEQLAVRNPLAVDIFEAVRAVSGLPIHFEPESTHPKDWSNPGRVRVLIRDQVTGKLLSPKVKNKNHLYILVAEYLRAHPPSRDSLYKIRYPPDFAPQKYEAPAVPKGWKINEIIPLHSAAVSGGGVSENFMKDMMAGMQEMQKAGAGGQIPPGMADGANGRPSSSKGKKK